MSDQFPPPAPEGDQPVPEVPQGAWLANPGPGPMPGSQPRPAFPGPAPDRSTSSRLRGLVRYAAPVIAIGIGVAGYLGQADRDDAGAIVGAGDVAAEDLRVGDCYDTPEVSEVSEVAAIPCSDPHDNEVFHLFELTGDTFPSDDVLFEQVEVECLGAFESFVGTTYEESVLAIAPMSPTPGSWDDGDRVVTCSLYNLDGSKLTGSAAGTAR